MRRSTFICLALTAACAAPPAATAAGCDQTGSPAALVASLQPGQVGCVPAGTSRGDVKITRPGITLTSAPGARSRILGRVWIAADDVTISGLDLDARTKRNMPSLLVTADRASIVGNDVTNHHTAICIGLGAATWKPRVQVRDVLISGNRIHDCGRLPAGNHDHGIYVENAKRTQILGNAIFDNADRAINLYPNADDSVIRGNVMDGNGEGVLFSGDLGMTSDRNLVEGNLITNPRKRDAVESWWPQGRGRGNVLRGNCVHGGAGTIDEGEGGFLVVGNLLADPRYRDRAGNDFRLDATSPCAAVLGTVPALPGGVTDTVTDVLGGLLG